MHTLIDHLDALHKKATPGNWMHNEYYEMAHTHSAIHKLTPLLMYHPRNDRAAADMAHAVAQHNAWPAILRALRALERIAEVPNDHLHDVGDCSAIAREALEGLVKP